ncbi:Uncharacterised protein [Legionella beliardensis]|uniref:Uncharacterized protein n=1 Tax=Legionella beliardensis TaxID=91822 RepID=A0A378I4D9_9GAMM|nr:hypothetical protein [Legionella beliardensis]STX29610.1 Uncharacterised protein [Legionella beliardensis]
MLNELAQQFSNQIENFKYLLLIINALLHVLFAGAVARDAGSLNKTGQRLALVSAPSWAFATLLGGVVTAAIYWFIHHSTITRPTMRDLL